MKQVKRLVGNEIELGINIPTIESRASNIPMDNGNYVHCHNDSTDKDLRAHPSVRALRVLPEPHIQHPFIK